MFEDHLTAIQDIAQNVGGDAAEVESIDKKTGAGDS